MGSYNDNSVNEIIVPTVGGNSILSPSHYEGLSPKNYKLDEAIDKASVYDQTFNNIFETYKASYYSNLENLQYYLGPRFFSVNNKGFDIINAVDEKKKYDNFLLKVFENLDSITDNMRLINELLDKVEEALCEMVNNYKIRLEELNDYEKAYNKIVSVEPNRIYYPDDESFKIVYDSWSNNLEEARNDYNNCKEQLDSDEAKTYGNIDVSWFCAERN